METLPLLVAFTTVIVIWFVIPAHMAANRNRSVAGWVLGSILFSPMLAIFLLFVLGDAENA